MTDSSQPPADPEIPLERVQDVDDNQAEDNDNQPEHDDNQPEGSTSAKKKKRRSKKKKITSLLTGQKEPQLTDIQLSQMLENNLTLQNELEEQTKNMTEEETIEWLRRRDLADLMTGASVTGKNKKDMGSHDFWKTQPVPQYDDKTPELDREGPIKQIDPAMIPNEPDMMYPGFEWVTMDLTQESELEEVYTLLQNHYVEDAQEMFRFRYSASFLDWALKSPGWKPEFHVGVRASESRKLVAFISAIPATIRVRHKSIVTSEINFLCVHKKLRNKRLTPVLIKEITRRSHKNGIFQGLYTAGTVLPKPIAVCRYYHRSLNWEKLYEVGFSQLPMGYTPTRMKARLRLPSQTTIPGLRPMTSGDIDGVQSLLSRYLQMFDFVPHFSREEVEHWFLHRPIHLSDRVIYAYVVEDDNGKITDLMSFYNLDSTVIANSKHESVRAAYLYYYATEAAWSQEKGVYKKRLNDLAHDGLILAKTENFDVFNALTILHNPMFLNEQIFGAGDGFLHYYLYNYRMAGLLGGISNDKDPKSSEEFMGGVGMVML